MRTQSASWPFEERSVCLYHFCGPPLRLQAPPPPPPPLLGSQPVSSSVLLPFRLSAWLFLQRTVTARNILYTMLSDRPYFTERLQENVSQDPGFCPWTSLSLLVL